MGHLGRIKLQLIDQNKLRIVFVKKEGLESMNDGLLLIGIENLEFQPSLLYG